MNIALLLARAARLHPDRGALWHGAQPLLDYRALGARCAALAGWLRAVPGLAAGERVALCMSNDPTYLEALYAALWAGLTVVPINAKLHPREVAYIVADAGAGVLCATADLADALAPALAGLEPRPTLLVADTPAYARALQHAPLDVQPCAPDDLAWLFYTSGTTGWPKGVMLTQRNLGAMSAAYYVDVDPIAGDDATVYAAPMSHGAGLYSFAFMARAARHVVPAGGGFDPAELCALAVSVGRLCLFAAPTMVRRLVDHVAATGADCSGFKTIVYGGGPMYAADIERALAVMGPRFVQIYGQGESPMTITALAREHLLDTRHPRHAVRLASVGTAFACVELRVADAQGAPLPPGQTGEVLVRGDTVMAGYWRNPQASASALRDGWLWTGDLGALDEDGFLTLKDRSKDLIISGGSNIYPREVEEVLLRHPAVREAAVVGAPDPEWGERVVAFVVGDDGAHAAALDAWCVQHIARFKRPKEYRFVAALPKNNYGKVLKTTLRQWLQHRPAADT